MKGDAKVVEYLNKALRHELTAINQYWLHYRLLDNWGLKDLAKKWRKESIEEMEHADKIVERIIFLDGFPNMQVLDPLHIGQNVSIYDAHLRNASSLTYEIGDGRHAWLQVIDGGVRVNGTILSAGDGAAISDETSVTISADEDAHLMLFDLA